MRPGAHLAFVIGAALVLAACGGFQGTSSSPTESEPGGYEMITLLPRDAIRSIDEPRFYSAQEADREYAPDERVLGVDFDGDARAYSVGLLSSHEIVNDVVGGHPIAVTW